MRIKKLPKDGGTKPGAPALREAGLRRFRSWIIPLGVAALVAGILLVGIVLLGRATRDDLRNQERFLVDFAAIACDVPQAMNRSDFLSEVQYLAGMPSKLPILDPEIGERLSRAFAMHPWVDKVEEIQITSSQTVRARLAFRTPVLGVLHDGQVRAVDRHGILLPSSALTEGLPIFAGHAKTPQGPAGTPWGDAAVEKAAAQTALRNRPH
jgi:hypothetical protein